MDPIPHENRLLAAMPAGSYRRFQTGLERVELAFGQVLYEPGATVRHVYFPNDSLLSLLVAVDGDDDLEVGMVGREGMLGWPTAMGRHASPVRVLVQGAGSALRMRDTRFNNELAKSRDLRRQLDRSLYVAMTTAMQIAACNKFHRIGERMARWLLMMRERLGRNEFPLTQDFLARMLGVRRAGVSEAAADLHRRGLLVYNRGRIRILNLEGLRSASCRCYEVIRKLESATAR